MREVDLMMFGRFLFTRTPIGPCFPGFGAIFHALNVLSFSKHMNLKLVGDNFIMVKVFPNLFINEDIFENLIVLQIVVIM